MSVLEERLPYIDGLHLKAGSHPAPNNGLVNACVMEAVAYIAGEPWSDHPECASPVLGAFLRNWNDSLPDADRQMLKPYIVRLVGTNTGLKDEETRAWLLTDWLARECAPAWMRLAGLTEQAELVEALAPITSSAAAKKAQPTLTTARYAAGDAARDAARNAARNAAWDSAWDATRNAAGYVARNAARNAAWDAARSAARNAAGDSAWDATRNAAGYVARNATRNAAGDAAWNAAWNAARSAAQDAAGDATGDAAWNAIRNAAWDALYPTVKDLQASALLLLDRMIEVGR